MAYITRSPYQQGIFSPNKPTQKYSYNPQFNGWDSAQDMPTYDKNPKYFNTTNIE